MVLFTKTSSFSASSFVGTYYTKPRSKVERHLDDLLADAVETESVEIVQYLLRKGAQAPNGARTDYDSPDDALQRGHAWVDLIDRAALSSKKDNKSNNNNNDDDEAAAKADVLIRKSGHNGLVSGEWVDYAIRHEKTGALRAILSKDGQYYRPNAHQCEHLHVAVDTVTPNLEILELLLQSGLENVNKIPKKDNRPYAGEAPLHVATRRKCPAAIRLLRKYGANVDIRGKNFRRTVRVVCAKIRMFE